MKKIVNEKGFTLIELLAVIVILGVILAIAIPSMTGYIENSKKDTMISTAQQYIESARNLLIAENALPTKGNAVVIPTETIGLEKGGNSPYTNEPFVNGTNGAGKSYVVVYNAAAEVTSVSANDYVYAITLNDGEKSCIQLVSEKYLTSSTTREKRALITTSCTESAPTVSANASVAFSNVKYYADETKRFSSTAVPTTYYQ